MELKDDNKIYTTTNSTEPKSGNNKQRRKNQERYGNGKLRSYFYCDNGAQSYWGSYIGFNQDSS